MDRKEFIHASTRVSLLTLILVFLGWLVARNKLSVTRDCTVNKYCRNCGSFNNCSLPAALKAREKERG